jgi:hypothetical protein
VRPQAAERQANGRVCFLDLPPGHHGRPQDLHRQLDCDSLLPLHTAMERNGNNNASDSTMHRCRLCTSNDDEALIEHLAEKLWDSRIARIEAPIPWNDAGATWQFAFRELAVAARQALTEG